MTIQNLDDFINLLCDQLGETEAEPIAQIRRGVEKRGPMVAAVAYQLAKQRYEQGETISDGSRRRTLGGCFFLSWKEAKRIVKARQEGKDKNE